MIHLLIILVAGYSTLKAISLFLVGIDALRSAGPATAALPLNKSMFFSVAAASLFLYLAIT